MQEHEAQDPVPQYMEALTQLATGRVWVVRKIHQDAAAYALLATGVDFQEIDRLKKELSDAREALAEAANEAVKVADRYVELKSLRRQLLAVKGWVVRLLKDRQGTAKRIVALRVQSQELSRALVEQYNAMNRGVEAIIGIERSLNGIRRAA